MKIFSSEDIEKCCMTEGEIVQIVMERRLKIKTIVNEGVTIQFAVDYLTQEIFIINLDIPLIIT